MEVMLASFAALPGVLEAASCGGGSNAAAAALQQLREGLDSARARTARNPVRQEQMDNGGIELF
jgi:hypothetical protein